MKVWLDDERPPPHGWTWSRTASDAIYLLDNHNVTYISLDHDLGDAFAKTGYDVAKWIEGRVHADPEYKPPVIEIHTGNPVGRRNIQAAIDSIKRFQRQEVRDGILESGS